MLQQILSDMFIDPDLLMELDDEQKHTLFCKMRQEQVRRWKKREEELEKEEAARKMRRGGGMMEDETLGERKKKVQFLLGNDGEPWTWVMGEHPDDESVEEIIDKEVRQNAVILAEKEMEKLCTQVAELTDTTENAKGKEKSVFTVRNIRGELSNPRPPVPPKDGSLLQKHLRLKEQRVNEIYAQLRETQRNATELSEMIQKEQEQEQLWRERERKAKEAERQIREIARQAREEHKVIQEEKKNDLKVSIRQKRSTAFAFGNRNRRRPNKPSDRNSIIEWFRNHEIQTNGSGINSVTKSPLPWFHGLISRNDAETLLNPTIPGTFLVRLSERIWGYAISYKAADRCKHFLIDASGPYYQFFGAGHLVHATLADLVAYHEHKPITTSGGELLLYPCPHDLKITNFNGLF